MAKKETTGKVISLRKQRWLKVNTKPYRILGTDGALYPYIEKIQYTVNGKDYVKRQWIITEGQLPEIGSEVKIIYDEDKPSKAKIL